MSYERSLEQYKVYLDMIERVSDRRIKSNNFFIAVISALLSIMGFISANKYYAENEAVILFLIWLFCLLLCKVWIDVINSYARLNAVKFNVIIELEKELKHNCLACEWAELSNDKGYSKLSKNEKKIPLFFALFLVFVFLVYTVPPILSYVCAKTSGLQG